jgi:hypothetical protein
MRSWPRRSRARRLRDRISDDVYDRIRRDAHEVLAPFTAADGTLEAPFECHVVTANRP